MSAKVDTERRDEARHVGVQVGRGIVERLKRLLDLYDEGRSDRDIALAFGWEPGARAGPPRTSTWSPSTVRWYRRALLKLRIDAAAKGAKA